MCVSMCTDLCIDLCIDMWVHPASAITVYRDVHVHGAAYIHVTGQVY